MFWLGPYALEAVIGRGGTATVWRARRVGSSVGPDTAAVKVLRGPDPRDSALHAAFRREVRAVAGLHHPHILGVWDLGVVPDDVTGHEDILPGAPWLAMELASPRTLKDVRAELPWEELASRLSEVLAALAHAHARRVVHRDVKPRNVLLSGGRAKLADFGLALTAQHAPGDHDESVRIGTPQYMAPEQLEGRRRDLGPWTDLYGLGCLAWEMVTGRPPFASAHTTEGLVRAHLTWPVPPLRPAIRIPKGLGDWLSGLLVKDPARRCQRAADAAWALARMGPPEIEPYREPSASRLGNDDDTIEFDDTEPSLASPSPARPVVWNRPPLPELPNPALGETHLPLRATGTALVGLRTVPMVGRAAERAQLWRTLQEVLDTGAPHAVVITGPAGTGKSRLAAWLMAQAHQVGVAEVGRALYGDPPSPNDGLAPMVARALGSVGMSAAQIRGRLQHQIVGAPLPLDEDIETLSKLLASDGTTTPPGLRRRDLRHALLRRWIDHWRGTRCAVLVLEDVAFSPEALAFLSATLTQPRTGDLPLLAIATASDEDLGTHPESQRQLDALLRQPNSARIALGPLEASTRTTFIEGILGLDTQLASRVRARTGGHPMFAIQLVGDWVQRGLLEPGPGGLRLVEGANSALPDNLHQVWQRRLNAALEDWDDDDRDALELAACAGRWVDAAHWQSACDRAGLFISPGLIEHLIQRGLARQADRSPEEAGWGFAHDMLRECLERQAEEGGRRAGHHQVLAEVLVDQGGPQLAERLGRHLLVAGSFGEALRQLTHGVRQRMERGDFAEAEALMTLRDQAIDAMSLPDDDPRHGAGMLIRIRLANVRGDNQESARWADRAAEAAEAHGWTAILAQVRMEGGRNAYSRGDLADADASFAECLALALTLGDRSLAGNCRHLYGELLWEWGKPEEGRAMIELAGPDLAAAGDPIGVGNTRLGLGSLALWEDRHDDAIRHAHAARAIFEQELAAVHVTYTHDLEGEVNRRRGDLDAAARSYRIALERNQASGLVHGMAIALLNLALVALARGDIADASNRIRRARELLVSSGTRLLAGSVTLVELACAVGEGRWDTWAQQFQQALHTLGETGVVHTDLAWLGEWLGARAAAALRGPKARQAWTFSLNQWARAGYPADAARVRDLLDAMPPGPSPETAPSGSTPG